jgi:uncharacterized protein YggT (Ycf19 family)
MGMMGLISLVHLFFYLLDLLVFVGIILSWVDCIRLPGATWLYSPPVNLVRDLTFAVLRPFRNLYNMILRAAGIRGFPIDFSPILAFMVFNLVEEILIRILWRIGGGIG